MNRAISSAKARKERGISQGIGGTSTVSMPRVKCAVSYPVGWADEVILIETEDGVQRMTVREMFDDFERDTAVIALSRAQMREIGFGVTPMVGDAGPGVMPGLVPEDQRSATPRTMTVRSGLVLTFSAAYLLFAMASILARCSLKAR